MKQEKVSLVSHMLALVGYLLFACGRGVMGKLQLLSGVPLDAVVSTCTGNLQLSMMTMSSFVLPRCMCSKYIY